MYKIMKKMYTDFKEMFLKLVTNDRSNMRFLLTSKLNHEKMCIKTGVGEILFKRATNDHSDEIFLLT